MQPLASCNDLDPHFPSLILQILVNSENPFCCENWSWFPGLAVWTLAEAMHVSFNSSVGNSVEQTPLGAIENLDLVAGLTSSEQVHQLFCSSALSV